MCMHVFNEEEKKNKGIEQFTGGEKWGEKTVLATIQNILEIPVRANQQISIN